MKVDPYREKSKPAVVAWILQGGVKKNHMMISENYLLYL
jgi:hypothetical protein